MTWFSTWKSWVGHHSQQITTIAMVVMGTNFLARWFSRLLASDSQEEIVPSLAVHLATAAAAGIIGFLQARKWFMADLAQQFLPATLLAAIAIAVVGPYISGGTFHGNVWLLLGRVLLTQVVALVGVALGVAVAIAVGADPLTKLYKHHERRHRRRL